MVVPFTGRETERRRIASLVDRLATGQPGGLVFVGQAGVGKSRLLRDATPSRGVRRYDIVGYEPESTVPLGAVRPLLAATQAIAGEPVRSGTAISELSEPIRVFEAVFATLSASGPVLLVVDDLQWLDPPSAALLHYLVRGAIAGDRPIALLAATRPGGETAATLAALERIAIDADGFDIVPLEPLSQQESIDLVRATADGVTEAEASALWRSVGGSPYWLLALTLTRGTDRASVLDERLRRISADGSTLIALLAVAGRPAAAPDAARWLDWPTTRLAASASELVKGGLALEAIDGFRLAHDLIREAVLHRLPIALQRRYHVVLAAAYASAAEGDVQGLQAALRHRIAAGLSASDLALRIAVSERRRWLDREAIEELGRIADETDPADPAREALAMAVAHLASEVGESAIAFERWVVLASMGPLERRAETTLAAAREAFRLRRPAALEDLLTGPEAPDWSDVDAVEVGAIRASSRLWLEARFPEGRQLATEVVEQAAGLRSVPSDDVRRRAIERARWAALKVAFDSSLQAGDWQVLRPMALQMLDVADGLDDRGRIEALVYDSLVLDVLGDFEAGASQIHEALRIARSAVIPDLMIEAGVYQATSLERLGRLAEAEEAAKEAAELSSRAGDFPKLRSRPEGLVHRLAVARGPWREAVTGLEAFARSLDDPHYRLTYRQMAASARSKIEGRRATPRIVELVGAGLDDARVARCPRCLRDSTFRGAASLARVGRRADGRRLIAIGLSEGSVFLPEPPVAAMFDWASALAEDDDRTRVDRLRAVAPDVRLAWGEVEGLWAKLDLGRAQLLIDAPSAAALIRDVGGDAERIGARTIAQLADSLLRGLGQRTWRRGRAQDSPMQLSEREVEVARLVAGGASNAEVAAALFVSVKTVERHVSNVLSKVDARNRTELAQRWSSIARSEGIPG